MASAKCPSCGVRKPRRSCPALGETICTVCCATKRQVEIACPSDCVYLTSARSHPPAVVQRRQERDLSFVLPLMSDLTETQYRLLLVFQSAVVAHEPAALSSLRDEDIAEAAAAAASTLETARKGIIYEHQAAAVPAQRLTAELGRIAADLAARAGAHQGRIERDAAIVLRRIEQGARSAATALAGDAPPVYLNLLARMHTAPPGESSEGPAGPAASGSGGLIITP
jgi:hypothetical protein